LTTTFRHWLKFNAVGLAGVGVQLLLLTILKTGLGMNYLLATLIAVETTILHNFAWHERWTWIERVRRGPGQVAGRLWRFHLGNGLISIAGNLILMWLLVDKLHLHYFASNILAIATCSLVNFMVSDRLVFT
jgi:dolichol-phosphate mannosyltransferase